MVAIAASPSLLKKGLQRLVKLEPEKDVRNASISIAHEGMITKANDDGLALIVTTMTRQEAQDSPLSGVPLLNRLARNIGIARMMPDDKAAKV